LQKLSADFNQTSGRVSVLRHVNEGQRSEVRYAVIQNGSTHPGFGCISMKDLKQICYEEGLFFDVLQRTGFKMIFFDIPGKWKNSVLTVTNAPETALGTSERNYSFC
jgi:hypothetical protein